MKVLLVNDYAAETGGAEVMLRQVRDGLRTRGHDARVLASGARLVPGVETFSDWSAYGTTRRWQALTSAWNPSARSAISRALREFDPDLVHVKMFLWQLSPSILPFLSGRPALYQVVTYKVICPNGTKLLPDSAVCRVSPGLACWRGGCLSPPSALAAFIQRFGLRRARRVFRAFVAPSRAVKERLEGAGLGPVTIIPNGTAPRPSRPPLADPPMIGYAGRLAREKGVDSLLRAFAISLRSAPRARLVVAGDGPERPALEALARREGIEGRGEFLGHRSRGELERLFDGVWAQAIPSLWEEPFGLVAIEAMMRGTAVVASRAGGLREIVRDGSTGRLLPAGDEAAWGAELARLATDRGGCERLGAAGREVALAEYGLENHLDRLEEVYRDLVAPRGRPGRADA